MGIELWESLGRAVGGVLAPLVYEGSLIRGTRLFHPSGVVYRGVVTPIATLGPVGALAQRLAGQALLRLSSGLRNSDQDTLDALGIALRLRASELPSAVAEPGDQDLLFVSSPSLWQLPLAPLITCTRDFLRNDYYALLPFDIDDIGPVLLRLARDSALACTQRQGRTRAERLTQAVAHQNARFRLELRRPGLLRPWQAVALIELIEPMNALDQSALAFHPFRCGRGIRPRGFFQAVRVAVYAASQLGRSLSPAAPQSPGPPATAELDLAPPPADNPVPRATPTRPAG